MQGPFPRPSAPVEPCRYFALPAVDSAALGAAEAQHDSLEISAVELAFEAQAANAEAGKIMDEVRTRASAVMEHDARRLMAELIAARDIFWTLTEHASGFFLMDQHRSGGSKFAALKDDIAIQLDRASALVREHPELMERWKLERHQDEVNASAERQWHGYFRRLLDDENAVFDAQIMKEH